MKSFHLPQEDCPKCGLEVRPGVISSHIKVCHGDKAASLKYSASPISLASSEEQTVSSIMIIKQELSEEVVKEECYRSVCSEKEIIKSEPLSQKKDGKHNN